MKENEVRRAVSSQSVVDRFEITDLICSYAACIDASDFAGLRDTLDDDCRVRYGNMAWVNGIDATMDQIITATQGMPWQHHLLNVYSVDVDDDTAKALVYHTSHQSLAPPPGTAGLLVGRYVMSLRRVQTRWKLTEVLLEVVWSQQRTDDRAALDAVGGAGPLLAAFGVDPDQRPR